MLRGISNPPNPWSSTEVEYLEEIPAVHLEVFEDDARTILSKNDPSVVGFEFGLNPYRGCQHACSYCEARRRHEYLGFGAGTDFDAKIVVKPRAPELLREAFEAASWKGDVVVFSGSTDCYQPLEASYQLTRRCLEVCEEYRNPVAVITKGALVERDIDLLVRLRDAARVTLSLSIPIWNAEVARRVEPLVPTPQRRIKTIERLARAGLDVGVSIAPMIPALSEEGLVATLEAAREAGARRAVMSFLRLEGSVAAVFESRVHADLPQRAPRILARTREMAERHAPGPYAEMVESLFAVTCRRLGLAFGRAGDDRANTPHAGPVEGRTFRRPARAGTQLGLF